jgi:hypothetical protein
MPLLWSEKFETFYHQSYLIWLHWRALQSEADSRDVKILSELLPLARKEFEFPPLSEDFSETIWNDGIRSFLKKSPVQLEEVTVRKCLVSPLSPEDTFDLVLQVYLALQFRDFAEELAQRRKLIPSETIHGLHWKIDKAVNLLIRLYLPGVEEEASEQLLKVLQALYGQSFVLGVQKVLDENVLKEMASLLIPLWDLLGKTADKGVVYRNQQYLHIMKSNFSMPMKVFALLEIMDSFPERKG